jgi:hypothetical protein
MTIVAIAHRSQLAASPDEVGREGLLRRRFDSGNRRPPHYHECSGCSADNQHGYNAPEDPCFCHASRTFREFLSHTSGGCRTPSIALTAY